MDFVTKNLKAIVTFVLGIVLQAANDIVSGRVPVENWQDGLRYIGTSLVAAAIVWVTGNKLNLGQILNGTRKLETDEQAVVARRTLQELPNPVSDAVVQDYPTYGRHTRPE